MNKYFYNSKISLTKKNMILSVIIHTNNNNIISNNIVSPTHMPLESEWVKKALNQFDVVVMSYKNYKLLKLRTIYNIPIFSKIVIIDDTLNYICKNTIIVKSLFEVPSLVERDKRLLLVCDNDKIKAKDILSIAYITIVVHDTMKPDPLGEKLVFPRSKCVHFSHIDDENSESFVVKIFKQFE